MQLTKMQAAAELARRSLADFARVTSPELSLGRFHRTYYEVLDRFARGELRRLMVSIPPQHGKSMGASVLLPSFVLGLNPSVRIALASYNVRLAARFNRRIQQMMETSTYRAIFPDSRLKTSTRRAPGVQRTAEAFDLVGQKGGLLCVGREGSLTGNPVDLFILDDLYKDAMEANSPVVRENIWEWYNAVVRTRLHNASQELMVFTRWHEEDLMGRVAKVEEVRRLEDLSQCGDPAFEGWWQLNLPAIQTGAPTPIDGRAVGEALWPERHSVQLLAGKRRLDPMLFETMYQGVPSVREGLLYGDRWATYDQLPAEPLRRQNYTDTADMGTDYLCSVCYAIRHDDPLIYVTDLLYTPLPMEQSLPLLAEMLQRNRVTLARVESNNGGRGFAREMARVAHGVRVEWFHQSQNKEARILSNASTVLQRLRFPRTWSRDWCEFYGDVSTFRRLFRSNRRDDAADVLTGIVETESDAGRARIHAVGFVR